MPSVCVGFTGQFTDNLSETKSKGSRQTSMCTFCKISHDSFTSHFKELARMGSSELRLSNIFVTREH